MSDTPALLHQHVSMLPASTGSRRPIQKHRLENKFSLTPKN
jgi:hypothetical protein